MSKLDVESQTSSNFENYPIHHSESVNLNEAAKVKSLSLRGQDTLQTVAGQKELGIVVDCDHPTLAAPDQEKVTGLNQQQALTEIKSSVWKEVSFLAAFAEIMNNLLDANREIHLKEALAEIKTRTDLYDLAKTSGALAKALMNNAAQEQMVQAISSFASAAVSVVQMAQTTRNMGKAKDSEVNKKMKSDINVKKVELQEMEKSAGLKGGETPEELKAHPDIKTKREEIVGLKRQKLESISREADKLDRHDQYINDAQQKSITAMAAVLNAGIKTDSGVKEELQKLNDGFMQVMNKYHETLTKSRDDSAANFSRFIDFLNKIIESDFKTHSISGRA